MTSEKIQSDKMNHVSESNAEGEKVVLVYGSTGWIGSKVVGLLSSTANVRVVCGKARVENLPDLCAEVKTSPSPSSRPLSQRSFEQGLTENRLKALELITL